MVIRMQYDMKDLFSISVITVTVFSYSLKKHYLIKGCCCRCCSGCLLLISSVTIKWLRKGIVSIMRWNMPPFQHYGFFLCKHGFFWLKNVLFVHHIQPKVYLGSVPPNYHSTVINLSLEIKQSYLLRQWFFN